MSALTAVGAIRFAEMGQSLMRLIEQGQKPVIAAIRGFCFGGGLDLALACRVRVASADASFAHPGAALGLLTGWGGTQRLPRVLGRAARARALETIASGQRITAQQAFEWGLVNRLVPRGELLDEAIRLARGVGRLT